VADQLWLVTRIREEEYCSALWPTDDGDGIGDNMMMIDEDGGGDDDEYDDDDLCQKRCYSL